MADSQRLGDMLTTINPATGEELDRYPLMTNREFEAAIEKCHEAFLDWRHEAPEKRAEIIKKIGEGLKAKKSELSKLMTDEMGKLVKQGEAEIDLCVGICDWTAENGPKELKNEERELPNGGKGVITYSPVGVIYGIQPWNFPSYQVVRCAIANLMAGNGVLLKHAESVTGSALMLAEIFEDAGLPKNLFTVLRISHDQSDKVIEHKLVRGVTLTGSSGAGKIVAKKAGEQLKKTVLELGSNDAYIVLEDADMKQAVKQCVTGRVFNNGETCVAAKRFIVVDAVYDQFRDAFVEAMKNVKMGDPSKNEGDIGPMAREDLRDDLHEQVEKSVKNGARFSVAARSRTRRAGGIQQRSSTRSNPASLRMMMSCSALSPHSSVPRMKTMPCGLPMTAGSALAAASSPRTRTRPLSLPRSISIPAWSSSTALASHNPTCRLAV